MDKVLVVIDMQKDFIDGTLGTPEAVEIVDKVVERVEKSANETILFTQDTHGEDYLSTPEGKKLPVVHCIAGTAGWEINEKIMTAWQNNSTTKRDTTLTNNTFQKPVFGSVALVNYLKAHEATISEIELVGICTDICVISNALMIKNTLPNTKLVVNRALCAGVTPESHERAIGAMEMCQIDVI